MNDSPGLRKRKFFDTLITIEAVFATLIFHLALVVLFTLPRNGKAYQQPVRNRIVMLSQKTGTTPKGKALLNWMEYGDPTRIAKPDGKYGYSYVCKKKGTRPPLPDRETVHHSKKELYEFDKARFEKLDPGDHPARDSFSRLWHYSPAFMVAPSGQVLGEIPESFPALFHDGKYIPGFFPGNQNLSGKSEKTQPEGPTVLRVKFFPGGLMPRISVSESCGREELDREAVRDFMSSYRKLYRGEDKLPENGQYIIRWR